MTDWQERVVAEKDELAEKIDKLDVFLVGRGASLGEDELSLLQDQRTAMGHYLHALEARIATFG